MRTFPHRYYVIADAAGADWMRQQFKRWLGDGDDEAEDQNCRTPLSGSADLKAEPTHFACSFAATDDQAARFAEMEAKGEIPVGVKIVRTDASGADAGKIKGATDVGHKAKIGQRMNFDAEVSALGLARHQKGDTPKPSDPKDPKPTKEN